MKKLLAYALLSLICLHGTGCTSMHVIEKAHGTPPHREDAQPAYYALVPFTAVLDVALGVFFGYLLLEGNSYGDDAYCPPSSSSRSQGLKVTRP